MKTLRLLWNFVLDVLFPITCIKCGKENEWVCKSCAESIPIEMEDSCAVCKKYSFEGKTCYECKKICALSGVVRFFNYDSRLVQKTLQVVKYGYVAEALMPLLKVLDAHIVSKFEKLGLDPRAIIFVPVPLHPRRLRERGFNQSLIIAEYFAQVTGGTVVEALARRWTRPPQVFLDEEDRVRNIKGNFKCIMPESVQDKYIFLVDDVTTTGSTLNECALTLQSAHPRDIWGIVLAKG